MSRGGVFVERDALAFDDPDLLKFYVLVEEAFPLHLISREKTRSLFGYHQAKIADNFFK